MSQSWIWQSNWIFYTSFIHLVLDVWEHLTQINLQLNHTHCIVCTNKMKLNIQHLPILRSCWQYSITTQYFHHHKSKELKEKNHFFPAIFGFRNRYTKIFIVKEKLSFRTFTSVFDKYFLFLNNTSIERQKNEYFVSIFQQTNKISSKCYSHNHVCDAVLTRKWKKLKKKTESDKSKCQSGVIFRCNTAAHFFSDIITVNGHFEYTVSWFCVTKSLNLATFLFKQRNFNLKER